MNKKRIKILYRILSIAQEFEQSKSGKTFQRVLIWNIASKKNKSEVEISFVPQPLLKPPSKPDEYLILFASLLCLVISLTLLLVGCNMKILPFSEVPENLINM